MRTARRYLVYALFGLILVSMIDTLAAVVSTPSHLFKIVAGDQQTVSGKLAGAVRPVDNPDARPFLSNRIQDPALLARVLAYAPAHPAFSLFKRWLGFDPWWATIVLLPAAFWAFYQSWKEAGRRDRALRKEGFGPIYRLAKRKDGWELIFGLGRENGILPGDRLQVFDSSGAATGQ